MPGVVLANLGVPMVFVQLYWMLFALIPIIVIEAIIAQRRLKLSVLRSITGVTVANAVSTFVGIPLAWFAHLGLNRATEHWYDPWATTLTARFTSILAHASWLPGDETQLYWQVPMALLVLLIPAYFMSVLVEYFVLRFVWAKSDIRNVRTTTWVMNTASYTPLLIANCAAVFLTLR